MTMRPREPRMPSRCATPACNRALIIVAAAMLALAGPVRAQVAAPQSVPLSEPLKVVSFNLAQVAGAPPSQRKPETAAWRTTFGSERRSPPPRAKEAALDADIVLLQGVSSMATLRQWFPPRSWKLVVSRQILTSVDEFDTAWQDGTSPIPTTALAIRYQPGLRVTAQDHLLDLAKPPNADDPPSAAGTAVRIKAGTQTVWALSADVPATCVAQGEACPALAAITRWRDGKRQDGSAVVTGGNFRAQPKGALNAPIATPTCATQALQLDFGTPFAQSTADAQPSEETGCTAAIEVARE
jgi:hypothetical protein